ncbi:tRNA (adenosine(37)-N6)-threonylcarbamoyltransferase complex ATPase subunit type 1 TsaE [Robiginitalea sp. IMCC43444]|uniref:tRNA (adenosine(37)-N6)-threonylcarbamoyltransferase complex ATPase subunit type 1 TsaE n=1 Tax=Robiginitalea sp. IMCC43444 TaxID=3459121 RepID=UPI0040415CBE
MEKIIYNIENIYKVAENLLSKTRHKTVCLYGPMGSGKTTLIKALITNLGTLDAGNSPSFGIINEYHNREGGLLALHYDCYRLKDEEEALDMGMEELLEADCWHFIEWPERIQNLLPLHYTSIQLEMLPEGDRILRLQAV